MLIEVPLPVSKKAPKRGRKDNGMAVFSEYETEIGNKSMM
jgi:hypothetical protein